jgi:hypothetical protein
VLLDAESDDGCCGVRLPPATEEEEAAPQAALPLQPFFGIEDAMELTRLDDSDDEGRAVVSVAQEQASDGKLVINGIEGRVALPGFEVGLMTRNAMKESLESAVQSFRSKSVVSRGWRVVMGWGANSVVGRGDWRLPDRDVSAGEADGGGGFAARVLHVGAAALVVQSHRKHHHVPAAAQVPPARPSRRQHVGLHVLRVRLRPG